VTVDAATGQWLNQLFAVIDNKDTGRFLGFLTDDARFRFGSSPSVSGVSAIGEAVDGFFNAIAGSRHTLHNSLSDQDTLACEGEVLYTRHDGSELTLPFANVFELSGNLISDYKIYVDIGPLFDE
jgi:hypothetical protein